MITLRQLLEDIVVRKASDLHITAGVPPEFRVDGSITPSEYEVLTPETCASIAYSVLSDAQRQKFETTRELDFSFGVKGLPRYRANVFLQHGLVSMAIRQIPYEILQLEKLGLPPVVRDFTNRQKGLVLLTGPTGSGKTTTLAAMLDKINGTRQSHIMTIEDPIEYIDPGAGRATGPAGPSRRVAGSACASPWAIASSIATSRAMLRRPGECTVADQPPRRRHPEHTSASRSSRNPGTGRGAEAGLPATHP